MNFILWLVFGALAGWLASIVMGTNAEQGALMNIVLGIIGAIVGGFVMNLFGAPASGGFDLYSLLVSIGGAMLLIWLGRAFLGRSI